MTPVKTDKIVLFDIFKSWQGSKDIHCILHFQNHVISVVFNGQTLKKIIYMVEANGGRGAGGGWESEYT